MSFLQNFSHSLVASGLANVDPRDLGSSDGALVAALDRAKESRVGIFSIESNVVEAEVVDMDKGQPEEVKTARVSEVRDGNTFFVNISGDDTLKRVEEKMAAFKDANGLQAGPVELRKGKVVAAMFDDGTGVQWYRAKVTDRPSSDGTAKVIYMDYGNVGKVTVKQVRMLDAGISASPPAAKEVNLALVVSRDLGQDDGVAAARLLSRTVWGKELTLRVHGVEEGRMQATVYEVSNPLSVNALLVAEGLARIVSDRDSQAFGRRTQAESVASLYSKLQDEQDEAKRARRGIWVYGDVGEDDDEAAKY